MRITKNGCDDHMIFTDRCGWEEKYADVLKMYHTMINVIDEFLSTANGKCRERLVNYYDVINAINGINDMMSAVPKTHRNFKVIVNPWHQTVPSAYGHVMTTSVFTLEWIDGNIYLTGCIRTHMNIRKYEFIMEQDMVNDYAKYNLNYLRILPEA